MAENGSSDLFQIRKNFMALALVIVAILLVIDIVVRVSPTALRPGTSGSAISAVGHHRQFADGTSYYIYTVFENNGDVYQCWWDEKQWNQKKVTNYRSPTREEAHE
jgi:hypothetical protein